VPCSPSATPKASAGRRWCGDGIEALAVSTRAPEAPAKGTGLVLLTLAAGQFLMTLDSSVMNVSIATVEAASPDNGATQRRDGERPPTRTCATGWWHHGSATAATSSTSLQPSSKPRVCPRRRS